MTKHDILPIIYKIFKILLIIFTVLFLIGSYIYISIGFDLGPIRTKKLKKYIDGEIWVEIAEMYPDIEFMKLPHKKDKPEDEIYEVEIRSISRNNNDDLSDLYKITNYVSEYLENNPDCKLNNKKIIIKLVVGGRTLIGFNNYYDDIILDGFKYVKTNSDYYELKDLSVIKNLEYLEYDERNGGIDINENLESLNTFENLKRIDLNMFGKHTINLDNINSLDNTTLLITYNENLERIENALLGKRIDKSLRSLKGYIDSDLWISIAASYPDTAFIRLPSKNDEISDEVKISLDTSKEDLFEIVYHISEYLNNNPDCELNNKKIIIENYDDEFQGHRSIIFKNYYGDMILDGFNYVNVDSEYYKSADLSTIQKLEYIIYDCNTDIDDNFESLNTLKNLKQIEINIFYKPTYKPL